MATPRSGACAVWATTEDLCFPCADVDYDTVIPSIDDMLVVATDILFELSGRQFPGSTCSMKVRPCRQPSTADPLPRRGTSSYGSSFWGYCGCNTSGRCGCSGISQINLGVVPVNTISEVKVDGAVVPSTSYRIDDWKWLVRLPDAGTTEPKYWPCCQRLDLADTEEDTFSVTFTYGKAPPPAGVQAAADLACQLALACSPTQSGECKLPSRVTSLTRQGVSMVVIDPQDFLENGRTGIYTVDLFLKTYNPNGNKRPGAVFSPDTGPVIRRAGT